MQKSNFQLPAIMQNSVDLIQKDASICENDCYEIRISTLFSTQMLWWMDVQVNEDNEAYAAY